MTDERLFDLVRYQRAALLDAALITEEEYAELALATSSPQRLATYDALRRERTTLRKALAGMIDVATRGDQNASRINRIKAYREATNCGLRDAIEMIEPLDAEYPPGTALTAMLALVKSMLEGE